MALSSARGFSTALDGLQHFPQFPEGRRVGRNLADAIWQRLHMDLREDMEREASPTAAIIDSQSLKSAESLLVAKFLCSPLQIAAPLHPEGLSLIHI